MPTRPPTQSQRTHGRRHRDQAYEHKRRTTPALREAKRIRDSKRWARFRRWFRSRHPWCCDPFALHCGTPAITDDVHHIAGLVAAPDLAFDATWCAPVCRTCHGRLSRMEQHNEPSKHMFAAWRKHMAATAAPLVA